MHPASCLSKPRWLLLAALAAFLLGGCEPALEVSVRSPGRVDESIIVAVPTRDAKLTEEAIRRVFPGEWRLKRERQGDQTLLRLRRHRNPQGSKQVQVQRHAVGFARLQHEYLVTYKATVAALPPDYPLDAALRATPVQVRIHMPGGIQEAARVVAHGTGAEGAAAHGQPAAPARGSAPQPAASTAEGIATWEVPLAELVAEQPVFQVASRALRWWILVVWAAAAGLLLWIFWPALVPPAEVRGHRAAQKAQRRQRKAEQRAAKQAKQAAAREAKEAKQAKRVAAPAAPEPAAPAPPAEEAAVEELPEPERAEEEVHEFPDQYVRHDAEATGVAADEPPAPPAEPADEGELPGQAIIVESESIAATDTDDVVVLTRESPDEPAAEAEPEPPSDALVAGPTEQDVPPAAVAEVTPAEAAEEPVVLASETSLSPEPEQPAEVTSEQEPEAAPEPTPEPVEEEDTAVPEPEAAPEEHSTVAPEPESPVKPAPGASPKGSPPHKQRKRRH